MDDYTTFSKLHEVCQYTKSENRGGFWWRSLSFPLPKFSTNTEVEAALIAEFAFDAADDVAG